MIVNRLLTKKDCLQSLEIKIWYLKVITMNILTLKGH